jgi:hypothetical protein
MQDSRTSGNLGFILFNDCRSQIFDIANSESERNNLLPNGDVVAGWQLFAGAVHFKMI